MIFDYQLDWIITVAVGLLSGALLFYINVLFERKKLQKAQIRQKVSVTISDTQPHVWIPFTQIPSLFETSLSLSSSSSLSSYSFSFSDLKAKQISNSTLLEPALQSLVKRKTMDGSFSQDPEDTNDGENNDGKTEKEKEREALASMKFMGERLGDSSSCFLCSEPLPSLMAPCGSLQDEDDESLEDCSMCCWCQRKLHNRCIKQLPSQICDYGKFQKAILPPTHLNPGLGYGGVPGWLNKRRNVKCLRRGLSRESEPILIFTNPRSGQLEGAAMLLSLRQLLNPIQVLDLSKTPPATLLRICKELDKCRILVCGGDGTVGWILNEIDKINSSLPKNIPPISPPIGVLPTGTSNDLSRVLGWGGRPDSTDAAQWLEEIQNANETFLDRWRVTFVNSQAKYFGRRKKVCMMNNYFSIGVDAAIALKFHTKRNKYPDLFRNRWLNRYVWYGFYGARDIFQASCEDLQNEISLTMDGKCLDGKLPKIEGIVVLNIQRYGGGTDVWGQDPEQPISSMNDQKFEVICFYSSLHLGQVITGVEAKVLKLGQAKTLTITFKNRSIPIQIDGEPWNQPPCTLTITHHNQVRMLMKKQTQ